MISPRTTEAYKHKGQQNMANSLMFYRHNLTVLLEVSVAKHFRVGLRSVTMVPSCVWQDSTMFGVTRPSDISPK